MLSRLLTLLWLMVILMSLETRKTKKKSLPVPTVPGAYMLLIFWKQLIDLVPPPCPRWSATDGWLFGWRRWATVSSLPPRCLLFYRVNSSPEVPYAWMKLTVSDICLKFFVSKFKLRTWLYFSVSRLGWSKCELCPAGHPDPQLVRQVDSLIF